MKKLLAVTACAAVMGLAGSASANLIENGDFETGDLTGWTTVGDVVVQDLNDWDPLPAWLASVQGMEDNFALLGLNTDSSDKSLSQDFTVTNAISITLTFDYAFDFVDVNLWKDDSFLAIATASGDHVAEITMLDLQSSLIGANYGHYEQTFQLLPEWTIDASMNFTLSEVGGFLSGGTASVVGIDNIVADSVSAPVPEPTTMLLFGTGLAGLAGVARRKRK